MREMVSAIWFTRAAFLMESFTASFKEISSWRVQRWVRTDYWPAQTFHGSQNEPE